MSLGWAAACLAVAAMSRPQVVETVEEAFSKGTLVHNHVHNIQFETFQNGLDGRQRPARTKWIKTVPKCAVSPRFGTFLF